MSEPGTVEWRFGVNGEMRSSPTVVDGTVYVGSYDGDDKQPLVAGRGHVYAVDAESGSELWHFETNGAVSSSPTVVDGTVYVGGYDHNHGDAYRHGCLHAVDAESGSELWHYETNRPVSSSPTVLDGTVYVGDDDGHLYALNPESGNCWWHFRKYKKMETSPMVVDRTLYVGSRDQLYAVDMENENVLWRLDELTGSEKLAVVDGTIYGGSGSLFYAMDAKSGSVLWESTTKSRETPPPEWPDTLNRTVFVTSLPTVVDETVYVTNGELVAEHGYLCAVDTEGGSVLWRFEMSSLVESSPTVVDETVYIGSEDGHLYAVDAESGNELWRFETDNAVGSSPIVVDGTVYFGSADGHLYAVSVGVEGSSEDSRVRQGTINHHHNLKGGNQTTVGETVSGEQGDTKESDGESDSILDTISDEFDEVGE